MAEAPAVDVAAPALPPAAENVLVFGRGVSLALNDETLIVRDRVVARYHRTKFCGIAVGAEPNQLLIPLYTVLWAEVADDSLVVDYAYESPARHIRTGKLTYPLGELSPDATRTWAESLLEQAYGTAQRCKRAKVLINPHAGPGGADKIWKDQVKPLFEAARMPLDVVCTQAPGEAIGICEGLDIDAFDIVVPCSGDGLPHECINGLGKRPDARKALRQVAIAHIPCGSGNAMSCNLNSTHLAGFAAIAIIKGVRTPLDLMSITQGSTRTLSFLSQSVGIIAECDLGTENLRWLGAARFNVGLAMRIFSKKVYPCDISMKVVIPAKEDIKAHYRRERAERHYTTRRENNAGAESLGESTQDETDAGDGLPPLQFGTINDKIPGDWETASHDKLGNFYCGNMAWMAPDANFFTAACPNDGLMDVVFNNGDISASEYLKLLSSVEHGKLIDMPHVSYRKVAAYRFTPRNQERGYISIDGEHFPFEPFQVEVHQGLGTVISKQGIYEQSGPPGWETAGV
ncbi:sphingoid long chain base kinase 4 [Durotheca rogersii]|uniref:sphingoid long chain base kinase 4 n=1 Tax=Durotheca rogersii TaxID=419775 RepID=UPI00222098AE|nr:sphingoid long chain base kinase 4 [Durotheca rogersii]KAI5862636.1 sphingoid long chain base kinase 4 [Durotheca rogersii]